MQAPLLDFTSELFPVSQICCQLCASAQIQRERKDYYDVLERTQKGMLDVTDWLSRFAHAQAVINAWVREYNEERPKKALGGLTPAHYARQLAAKADTISPDSKAQCY